MSVVYKSIIAYSCKLTFQTSENRFLRFDFKTSEISIHVLHRFTFAIYRLSFQTWTFKKSTSTLKNEISRSEIAFWTWIAFSEVEKCNLEVLISEVRILKVWKVYLHELAINQNWFQTLDQDVWLMTFIIDFITDFIIDFITDFQYKKSIIKSIIKSVIKSITEVSNHTWLQHKSIRLGVFGKWQKCICWKVEQK